MVEFLAARRRPLQQLDGAVDGDVFLVAGDQERDRAFWLAAIGGEIIQHRGDAAGDAALHVDGAAAVQKAVLDVAGERAVGPGALVARRHHVGMAGKGDVRRASADAGIEIVDIGGAGLAEGDAMHLEAGGFQDVFEHAERAGVCRGYRGAAQQVAGDGERGEGISHALRLTYQTGGGPALCGTISISLCCSQRGLVSTGASGSGPNRLVLCEPFRQYISTKPQMQRRRRQDPAASPHRNGRTGPRTGRRARATKNGTIHQPLLSRSCSRLIEVAK